MKLIGGTQNALQHAFLIVTVIEIHRLILDVCDQDFSKIFEQTTFKKPLRLY